jgi:hypothetical protein
VKLSSDEKVFVRLSSTPPPRSRLSVSQFEDPAQCTRSRYMTPRLYLHLYLSIERRNMDNPPRHTCLPVVYFLLFKVGITGVVSASVLFLSLGIGLGWRTTVYRYIVRLALYQRGYCEARGGFISTWVYFHFFYFSGRAKGPGKRE